MPRKCVVPGCKANYDTTRRSAPTIVTTFRFPQDERLRKKWQQAIPRKQWTPSKTSAVCINHFNKCDIISKQLYKDEKGRVVNLTLQHPRLKPGAVPKLFNNIPSHLIKKEVPQRTSPDVRREEASNSELLKQESIQDFSHFKSEFTANIESMQCWNFKATDTYILFYRLNVDCDSSCDLAVQHDVKIACSIVISSDMVVSVKQDNKELSVNDLEWVLPCDLKLTSWTQIENLLVRYKTVEPFEVVWLQ